MVEAAPESFWSRYCPGRTPRDRRNQARFTLTLFGWAVVFLGSSYLIAFEIVSGGPLAWGVATLPSLMAVFAVFSYLRYLREADELARTVELRALALALCAGFVIWPAQHLLEELGVPLSGLPNLTLLAMIVVYAGAATVGWRRYR